MIRSHTTLWSRIGLFESPKWKVPVENWREVKNCFRYITAIDPRVVEFDQPFYLLIDQQMEHEWPGKITNPEELPINMTIDWIRLFQ